MTTMNDAPLGYMPIPTVEQLAEALANVRCFHDLSAELIAPELLRNLLAAAPAHPAERQEQGEVQRLREALKHLLSYAERQICEHEETHRGGAIWEICDMCGAKWADDEGGKPEFKWPDEIKAAHAALLASAEGVKYE